MSEHSGPPWPPMQQQLRLGTIVIDLRFRKVVHTAAETELTPRVFDLLLLFLAQPGVLHTRSEIFGRIWPNVIVEDSNLTQSVWMLRKALGDGAKEWLHTVPKQGFVFDPPVAVEWPPEAASAVLTQPVANPAVALLPPVRPRRFGRHALAVFGTACLLLATLVFVLAWQTQTRTQRHIVLAAAADDALGEDTRWPVQLLSAWLEWKLRASSDVRIADAAAADQRTDVIVLLAITPAEGNTWQLSASIRGAGLQQDLRRSASSEQLLPALDTLSNETYRILTTAAGDSSWPELSLDPAAAKEFVAGLREEQRHHHDSAARHYRAVLGLRPDFGLARWRLLQSLAELGQQGAIAVELPQARRWIAELPPGTRAEHEAQSSALAQDFNTAAARYAALAQADGMETTHLHLAEASNLRLAGRSADALLRLGGTPPSTPANALPWLLERAQAALASGDALGARKSAVEAAALAARLGWPHEQARALMLQTATNTDDADTSDLLQKAQSLFDATGDNLRALEARYRNSLLHDDSEAQGEALTALLAAARKAGNASVEFDALRRQAYHHYNTGEMPAYGERLAQAIAVAEASGNPAAHSTAMVDLLHKEYMQGDTVAVQRRLAAVANQPLQGIDAMFIFHYAAFAAIDRGDYAAALDIVARGEASAVGQVPHAAQRVGLPCARGMVELARGEIDAAHDAFTRCRGAGFEPVADAGETSLALYSGDRKQARHLIDARLDSLAATRSLPDRSLLSIELATQLARLGDLSRARSLFEAQLDLLERAGFDMLRADVYLGLAEIDLAEGRVEQAADHAERATSGIPADDWQATRRLQTIAAAIDQQQGKIAEAAKQLEQLDAETRRRGDLLGELLVHSLIDTNPLATRCDPARHRQLIARSGLRGASDIWLLKSTDNTFTADPLAKSETLR